MLRLSFALWRRDVAIRKAAEFEMRVRGQIGTNKTQRREATLQQRARRWQHIANTLDKTKEE